MAKSPSNVHQPTVTYIKAVSGSDIGQHTAGAHYSFRGNIEYDTAEPAG